MSLIKKKVFVTVGTTKFDELIDTVLSSEVLKELSSKGYNDITLQIGRTLFIPDCTPRCGFINIEYFNLSRNIIEYIETTDLIISHAGAGSILDALENKKNLIVVTNENLMDNHQLELAEQLYNDKHLYYCTCRTLLNTIQIMNFAELKPLVYERSKHIAKLIDQIMGFSP
ncbi:UDP-N-acetylglucosamine transferase subunit ALG13 like protein [Eufriesea mexicana]|uniref:UDP-N-acetylglucosamine transferase subunit ALG13 n=1 Tax=Eufriesea mexicana TaxID=516756 RepID=A0A310S5M1_9HYME|nr:PREDICTED: UDP-N-acetylglucosamine transferase subunit ALG13 homolog [Eufriesea mexicana]OAD52817.1 UDP-N-acetylglucosamine transferase subunit ALG13 like protein [Eufriesea mexicana]